ncbi:MAG: autotransporter outer membrane beta-barrel domain-containing protein, partial [Pseudomonadota bacterium]
SGAGGSAGAGSGGGGAGSGGAGSGGAGSGGVSNPVAQAQNTLVQGNLDRQINSLTTSPSVGGTVSGGGGAGGAGGASGGAGAGGGAADPIATGDITTNTILREEEERETQFAGGLAATEHAAAAITGVPLTRGLFGQAAQSERAAWRALAGRIAYSSANASASAFDGAVGPVRDIGDGIETGASLPERRDTNLFLYGSYSDIRNRRNLGGDDRRFNGDAIAVTAGVDHRFVEAFTAGLSLSVISTDLDTAFNDGAYEELTFAVAPYAVAEPTDWLRLTGTVGYSYGRIDQTRNFSAVSGETAAHTGFANFEARVAAPFDGPIAFSAALGLSGNFRHVEAFTESDGTRVASRQDVTLSVEPEIEASWRVALAEGAEVEPFGAVAFIWDLGDTINQDNHAVRVGGGLRGFATEWGVTGELGVSADLGRDDYEEITGYGSISYGFAPGDADFFRSSIGLAAAEETLALTVGFSYQPGPVLPGAVLQLTALGDLTTAETAGSSLQLRLTIPL